MFSPNIDLGQVIIASLISIVGWFVKRTIDKFEARLDKHEAVIFNINGDLQLIMGSLGVDRRKAQREKVI